MKIKRNLKYIYNSITLGDKIPLVYYDQNSNWGDALNGYIFSKSFETSSSRVHHLFRKHILGIGSILSAANNNSVVVGSGFIKAGISVKQKPNKIISVRGPKSRQALLEQGIDCPEVYGDLALALPKIYNPKKVVKKNKVGFIPHFKDKNNIKSIEFQNKIPGIYVIDIMQDIESFIDDILSCELIVSSSLHGLIASDAYQVPNCWVSISDQVIGGTFKFEDYYESNHIHGKRPVNISELKEIDQIENNCMVSTDAKMIDKVYSLLMDSCNEVLSN